MFITSKICSNAGNSIFKKTFEPNFIQKFSRIKVHNALAVPFLVQGSKIWIPGKKKR